MLVDWAASANILLRMFKELTIHLTLNAQAEKIKVGELSEVELIYPNLPGHSNPFEIAVGHFGLGEASIVVQSNGKNDAFLNHTLANSPGNKKGLYCKAEHPQTSQTEAYSEAVNPSHPHTSIKTS